MQVRIDGQIWHITSGIATGLACAVHLANLYLSVLDDAVLDNFDVLWFARLVDDICMCVRADLVDAVVLFLNDWHENILWEVQFVGREHIPFLDLNLSITARQLAWETHRKPMNAYLYLPRCSTHHPSTFEGLIHGETTRLIHTNSSEASLRRNLSFFRSRLLSRGYSKLEVGRHMRSALRLAEARKLGVKSTHASKKNMSFLVMYVSATNFKVIKNIVRKHKHVDVFVLT